MKLGRKGSILIADDEETVRSSLADFLNKQGYTVHLVASGDEALAILKERVVDLVILDLEVPGMAGLDVLRVISRQAPDIPVILITAYGSLESAIEALRLHAFDYLVKPILAEQVLDSVWRGLAHRAGFLHKQAILEEMETSLRQLLESENRLDTRDPADLKMVYMGNGVMVDFDRRELWGGSGEKQRVHLTPAEGRLLKVLLERGGEVLTHRELVLMVQGYEVADWEAPEVIRPLVSRLRQKLEHFPGGEHWIFNVRGKGYLFERRGTKGTDLIRP